MQKRERKKKLTDTNESRVSICSIYGNIQLPSSFQVANFCYQRRFKTHQPHEQLCMMLKLLLEYLQQNSSPFKTVLLVFKYLTLLPWNDLKQTFLQLPLFGISSVSHATQNKANPSPSHQPFKCVLSKSSLHCPGLSILHVTWLQVPSQCHPLSEPTGFVYCLLRT